MKGKESEKQNMNMKKLFTGQIWCSRTPAGHGPVSDLEREALDSAPHFPYL